MADLRREKRGATCEIFSEPNTSPAVEDDKFEGLKMPYEDGMQLVFDLVDRTLVVSFRDNVKLLGPFENQKAAIHAGEKYCRDRGWEDKERPATSH